MTKRTEDLVPDRNGKLAVRVHPETVKKIDVLIKRAEINLGFSPTRGQIIAGLINKAIGGDNA